MTFVAEPTAFASCHIVQGLCGGFGFDCDVKAPLRVGDHKIHGVKIRTPRIRPSAFNAIDTQPACTLWFKIDHHGFWKYVTQQRGVALF